MADQVREELINLTDENYVKQLNMDDQELDKYIDFLKDMLRRSKEKKTSYITNITDSTNIENCNDTNK